MKLSFIFLAGMLFSLYAHAESTITVAPGVSVSTESGRLNLCSDIVVALKHAAPKWSKVSEQGKGTIAVFSKSQAESRQDFFLNGKFSFGDEIFNFMEKLEKTGDGINCSWQVNSDVGIETEALYLMIKLPSRYEHGKIIIDDKELELPSFSDRHQNLKSFSNAAKIAIPGKSGKIIITGQLNGLITASTHRNSFYTLRLLCSPYKGNISKSALDINVSVEGYISSASEVNTVISPKSSGMNWFPNDGYFNVKADSIPPGWNLYHTQDSSAVGLTEQFGFGASTGCLRITGSLTDEINIQTIPMQLPEKGELEFSIWARAVGEVATVNMYILGKKDYQWIVQKGFQLNDGWIKCTVKGIVPEKGPAEHQRFWCRLEVPKGAAIVIGRMELKWLSNESAEFEEFAQYPVDPALSRNLVYNPDFELGGWGWEQYFCTGSISELTGARLSRFYRERPPLLVNGGVDRGTALQIEPWTDLMTFCFPVKTGKEYTVSAFLKCATPGKTAECTILLIANNMKFHIKKFTVTDQWKRYSFSNVWDKFSRRKNAYVRINARGNEPILIDKIQAEQGKLSSFSTFPVQLGLLTPPGQRHNIISESDCNAKMVLKAVCRPEVKGTVDIKAVVSDAWGKKVSNYQFKAAAAPVVEFPIKVNKNSRRGVFHVDLRAFDRNGALIGSGISRYAVCKSLAQIELSDNPIAGHFAMWRTRYAGADMIMPVLEDYFRINAFNRCFFQYTPEHLQNSQIVTDLEKISQHWTFSPSVTQTWCMSLGPPYFRKYFGEEILLNKTVSQENLIKFKQKLAAVVTKFKDSIGCWELMNEPYGWRVETGSRKGEKTMEPEKAVQLYKAAHEVIKSVDPNIKLVGPCVALGYDDWTERFLKDGGGKWVDIFTVHGYCGNPDVFNTYGKLSDYRHMLDRYGCRDLQIWNTEQYFGARIPYKEAYEDEFFRDYFSEEINCATETVSNLINHAAAGVPVATFLFSGVALEGEGKDFFIYDYFSAANCAAEFLGNAGTGAPLEMGSALKCFLFPEAKNGALATIHTMNQGLCGTMLLPQEVKAYDMMGNPLLEKMVTLDHSIIYLRFPLGMRKTEVIEKLCNMELLGFGKAFSLAVSMFDKDTLAVYVNNRLNRPASGSVTIEECPKGWGIMDKEKEFSNLAPGKAIELRFRISQSEIRPLDVYSLKLKVKTGKEFFTEDMAFSSLYAKYRENIAGDGNLDAWSGIEKITLGKDHLSKKFSSTLDWTGPNDLGVDLMMAWNKKGLGIGIIVTDDQLSIANSPAEGWQYDSIQLYFDMKNNADKKNKNIMDDVVYQITFNGKTAVAYLEKGFTGRFIGEANRQEGIDADVKVSCRKLTNNKLFYDIFLPNKVLPMVNFKAGASMGFSLLVNDNDGKGRKTGITLAPKGKEPYNAPNEYKNLIFLHK